MRLRRFSVVFLLVPGSAVAQHTPTSDLVEQFKVMSPEPAAEAHFGRSVAMSENTLLVGAANNYWLSSVFHENAYVFVLQGSSWIPQATFEPPDQWDKDLFGWSVALSGDTAIVGAPFGPGGAAYVYVRSGTSWSQQVKLSGLGSFGWSLVLEGDMALIGAPDGSSGGSVHVLQRSGTTWTEVAQLQAPVPVDGDNFGWSLALSEETAVIGATSSPSSPQSSAAYVFTGSGPSWTLQSKLLALDLVPYENLGSSVAVSGDVALVASDSEIVRVFERNGTSWSQTTMLATSDLAVDGFGASVALSGNRALVGAGSTGVGDVIHAGAAYLFENTGVGWLEQGRLVASDAQPESQFGSAVALRDTMAIVGAYLAAPWDDGAAYVYALKPATFTNLGHALGGPLGLPSFVATGTIEGGSVVTLTLGNAAPSALAALVVGGLAIFAPFKGGVMVPQPDALVPTTTSPAGEVSLAGHWPPGVPPGVTTWLQWWIVDPSAVQGFAASNALAATTP